MTQARQVLEDERSIGDLFGELAKETGELVRQEVALATSEVRHSAMVAGRSVGVIAVGVLVGFIGLLALAAAAISLLSVILPVWASALIVAAVCGLAGYLITKPALADLRQMAPMQQTIESVKEDVKWLKKEIT